MTAPEIQKLFDGTEIPGTLAQVVARELRELIIDGSLPPGTVLRLLPLAKRLGVSMMPVRDALRLLEADKLVMIVPRRGAVVAEMSLDDAEEIYAVRVALEALCARHAAERLTQDDVTDIERLFGVMEAANHQDDLSALIEADHHFHERLYRTSGREQLIQNISELTARSQRYLPYLYRSWQVDEDPFGAHRPLLEAIRAQDPALVERLTREHMEAAGVRLLTAIQHESQGPRLRSERVTRWRRGGEPAP
jgi:DNA-binding GntR family transcriptional regulator